MHTLFSKLPIEVLFKIYSYLSPEEGVTIAKVNSHSRNIIQDQLFWKEKYRRHFPALFKTLDKKAAVNWYAEFRSTYNKSYRLLSARERRLFSLVKEADVSGLEAMGLTYKDLLLRDVVQLGLLSWVQHTRSQALFDYIYQLALKEYGSDDVNKKDSLGRTILHWTIYLHQDPILIELLIFLGADIRTVDSLGLSAFENAVLAGNITAIKRLLTLGCNINSQTAVATPLQLAICKDNKQMVDFLLDHHADLSLQLPKDFGELKKRDTAIHVAIRLGRKNMVETLLSRGVDIEEIAASAATPLMSAVAAGKIEIAELLLQRGANINARTNVFGVTPLLQAVIDGNKELVALLLKHHANISMGLTHGLINLRCLLTGDTPLHAAIKLGHIEIVEMLLDHGATVEDRIMPTQYTPLMTAASSGRAAMLELLLRRGANVDARDHAGATALTLGICSTYRLGITNPDSQWLIADILLDNHANTALALQHHHQEYDALDIGDTALHVAAKINDAKLIRLLINHNADTEVLNSQLKKPFDIVSDRRTKLELQVLDYLAKRSPKEEYIKSFTLCGHTFFNESFTLFGHKFNISKTEKLAAANALKQVLFHNADEAILAAHHDALSNGELGDIYKKLLR